MKATFITKSLFALGLMALAQPASASLTSRDLIFGSGDGLLTYDDVTNLEWLDLTATLGQSYNAVAGGFNGYTTMTNPFSIANVTQVGQLFQDAGMVQLGWAAAQYEPAMDFVGLVGCTFSCGSETPHSAGIFDFVGVYYDANYAGSTTVAYDPTSGFTQTPSGYFSLNGGDAGNNPRSKSVGNYGHGTWLYRDAVSAVPLPATLPLMASGFGLAGLFGWRRRRAAAV